MCVSYSCYNSTVTVSGYNTTNSVEKSGIGIKTFNIIIIKIIEIRMMKVKVILFSFVVYSLQDNQTE